MTELTQKEALLERSGYRYHFDRMIFFNRESRRALSLEYLEDHTLEQIQEVVDQPAPGDWTFYFNVPPSDSVKRELSEALG